MEQGKEGRLFTSQQILQVIQTTPSVKTRKAMIELLGPRITDVGNSKAIVDLFVNSADVSHNAISRILALPNEGYSSQ